MRPFISLLIEQHRPANSPVKVFITVQQPIAFFSDELRIKTILSCLISNVFRYAKPERASPQVNIEAKINKKNLQLQVEDNGIGIGREHIEHIFKMFYRATEHNHGSGIGLYIAKETVEKLSGSIMVRSIKSVGTTFSVTIPNMLTLQP